MGTIRDPLIGASIDDRYLILSALGMGATSSVYKAHDESSNKDVALKILHAHLAGDTNLVARFQREAHTAKILTHPNIVAVHDYTISEGGNPYLVMDFVPGLSLQQLLVQEGWLPLSKAVEIFAQICAALNIAHQNDVIHRDLKPGNIMLTPLAEGKYLVKILDFGCAQVVPMLGDTVLKVTQTGEMLGSLLYMSPEQCLDQDVDQRSDCYALGCVLYETLTGKPPLAARTAFETMNKHMTVMPDSLSHVRPDLSFPRGLEKVIFKAMAKTPAKRYQNVLDFMDELVKFSGAETGLIKAEKRNNDELNLKISKPAEVQNLIDTGPRAIVHAEYLPDDTTSGQSQNLFHITLVLIMVISLCCHSLPLFLISFFSCALIYTFLKLEKTRHGNNFASLDKVRRSPAPIVEKIGETSTNQKLKLGQGVVIIKDNYRKREYKEILIFSAEKREDHNIALEIGPADYAKPKVTTSREGRLKAGETAEIVVRPIDYQTYFWETFCDKIAYGKWKSDYPIGALMVKRNGDKNPMVIIDSHLSVVISGPGGVFAWALQTVDLS